MTTIAFRHGVMAADTQMTNSNSVAVAAARKIARGPDGRLHGICGSFAHAHAYLAWVKGGYVGAEPVSPKDDDLAFSVLVASPDGKVEVIEPGGRFPLLAAPYAAIGSGAGMALGAMHAGAGAAGAIAAAIEHDLYSGGTVQIITFGGERDAGA